MCEYKMTNMSYEFNIIEYISIFFKFVQGMSLCIIFSCLLNLRLNIANWGLCRSLVVKQLQQRKVRIISCQEMVKLFGKRFPDKCKRKLQTLSAARLSLPLHTHTHTHAKTYCGGVLIFHICNFNDFNQVEHICILGHTPVEMSIQMECKHTILGKTPRERKQQKNWKSTQNIARIANAVPV